jgi:hypothetical protein
LQGSGARSIKTLQSQINTPTGIRFLISRLAVVHGRLNTAELTGPRWVASRSVQRAAKSDHGFFTTEYVRDENALAVEAFNDFLKKHSKRPTVQNPLILHP